MSEEEKGAEIKLVDFQKRKKEERQLPPEFIEKLEELLWAAKEGKLSALSLYGEWEPKIEEGEELGMDDFDNGGLILWSESGNMHELVGQIEVMKTIAVSGIMSSFVVGED